MRLLFAASLGYGVDEAYAVTVARPISLSYFDHPPLHFWMAAAMTVLTGVTTPVVVRLPFLLAFSATTWAIAALTRRLYGEPAARAAALALASSGVLGVTAASWVLPDGPLLAASALAALVLAPLLLTPADVPPAEQRWRWLAGGALLGLAVAAKYHGALFMAAVGAWMLLHRDCRATLRTPWPWIGAALGLTGLAPTLVWNAGHQWASFRFQGARAVPTAWSLAPFGEMVGGQLAWLLPWIGVPLVIAAWCAIRVARVDRRARLLLAWSALPVLGFTGITLGGARGLPHWTAPGWLFVFPLLGAWATNTLHGRDDATPRVRRERSLRVAAALTASLVCMVIAHARWRVLDPMVPRSALSTDPTRDAVSWAPALRGDSATVLLVRSWIQGGQLGVAAGAAPRPIVCLCTDPHHFAYRPLPVPRWTHATLFERLQPEKRGWIPAPLALAGDSLNIVPRDTIDVDGVVRVARYDVTRR